MSTSSLPTNSLPFVHENLEFIYLDERYKCLVCHEVLKNPVQTECGHRMCEECLNKLFAEHGDSVPCPGNEPDCIAITKNQINQDYFARKELANLEVYCVFKKYGCEEKMKWKDLKDHIGNCQYLPQHCPYHESGCPEQVGRADVEAHRVGCEYRPKKCEQCNEVQPFKYFEQHRSACPKQKMSCQFCSKKEARENMESHLKKCSQKPATCKFANTGCTFEGKGGQLARHEAENMQTHLELLVLKVAEADLEKATLKRQLQEVITERDLYKNRLEKLDADVETLNQVKGTLETKMRNVQKSMVGQGEKLIKMEQHVINKPTKDDFDLQSRELVSVKDSHRELIQRIGKVETGRSGNMPEGVVSQLSSHDRQIGIQDVRLAEMDLRFQVLETANYEGVLIWKIRDYRRRKHEGVSGKTLSLYSQPFYTGRYGYKMCARVYLNGDGMGKGSHMSLFFVIMRGDYDALLQWPFKQKVTLTLLDQEQGRRHLSDQFRPDATSSSFKRPTSEMNVASGCPLFVSQQVLETGTTYVKDDTIFIKVSVDTSDLYGP